MHVQSHTYIKQVYLIRRQWRPAASSALCAVCLPSTQSLSSVDFHLCTCFAGPTKPTTYTQSPKQMRHANSANGNNHNHQQQEQQQHKKQQTQQQQTITTIVQQFNRSLCSWNQQKKVHNQQEQQQQQPKRHGWSALSNTGAGIAWNMFDMPSNSRRWSCARLQAPDESGKL